MNGTRYVDLTPEQLVEAQRLFAAAELTRQAYQDWLRAALAKEGVDADKEPIAFNPWTGRFTLPEQPKDKAG